VACGNRKKGGQSNPRAPTAAGSPRAREGKPPPSLPLSRRGRTGEGPAFSLKRSGAKWDLPHEQEAAPCIP